MPELPDVVVYVERLAAKVVGRTLRREPHRQARADRPAATLADWIERLRGEAGDWPAKVTAFHPAMAVHGRFGRPCPDCGAPVQRIVRADNEANYCTRCQNGGRLLADRAMSRLLEGDRPKHIDELG